MILEPLLQGAGGMAMVRPAFLQGVQERVRRAGALLIADEVLTGFGRCGALFACRRAGLAPDLMALSKGLTGGFLPMGVTMAREELFQGFVGESPELTLFHGHSFTGNPLGCAAALASLDLLEEEPQRYEAIEERHRPHLEALARHPRVRRPRLLGGIAAFDLGDAAGAGERPAEERAGYFEPGGREVARRVLEQGVYLRPLGSVIYLMPPLGISDGSLERCYAAIGSVL